jgi:hypothetical protein
LPALALFVGWEHMRAGCLQMGYAVAIAFCVTAAKL